MIQKSFNKRVYITGVMVIISACFFVVKLFSLHFSSKIFIRNPYDNKLDVRRGYIRDTNNNILAMTIIRYSLFANPEQINNKSEVSEKLSKILTIPKNKLLRILSRDKKFVWIERKLDDDIENKIRSLRYKGLYFKKEYQRVYPHNSVAANIIGFVGIDNQGLEGIEFQYNDVLNGKDNYALDETNNFVIGNDIRLTIDKYIQYYCEKILDETLKTYNAKNGSIVVMEVKTGKVLAIAKAPGFDPNNYYKYLPAQRHNFAIVDSFEPGSTMKIFSVAAMINSNTYDINKIYTCTGAVEIAGEVINCTGIHGNLNIHQAIKYSCNVAVIDAIKDTPNKILYKTLKDFAFGDRLTVEIPGESPGILRPVDKWSGLSKFSLSIGHELSITSLQLCAAYAAIANNGVYNYPVLIEDITKSDGTKELEFYPNSKGQIISKKTAHLLKKMLYSVVEDGTGKKAGTKWYKVAGKTGTAQKSMKRGGYYHGRDITSFAGFAPVDNPEISVVVIIDEPEGDVYGGTVAAPVFSSIVERILRYKGINNKIIKPGNPKKHFTKDSVIIKNVPDFKNKRLPDAINLLIDIQKYYSIKYEIYGTGMVYKQLPEAGINLNKINKIKLFLKE